MNKEFIIVAKFQHPDSMNLTVPNDPFHQLTSVLDGCHPVDWKDIDSLLKELGKKSKTLSTIQDKDALQLFAKGAAFITFSYGIDGVSMEMAKYAHALKRILIPYANPSIHFIGENFPPEVSSLFRSDWQRFELEGINGWNKWDDGKWFKALFGKMMGSDSTESGQMAAEIYRQAVVIAKRLGKYFIDNQISLVIPVNIASNPGNIALNLGLVMVSEILDIYVLNFNHDFYWESGKPVEKREPGEAPGVRDHFFRNIKNKTFFSLLKKLYPWNGDKWLQININARQSRKLIKKFDFSKGKVFTISTYISDSFFDAYDRKEVLDIRQRMGCILSGGETIMQPVPIANLLSKIDVWMKKQRPIIIGARPGLLVDPASNNLIIMLQPTRIVTRKRISRNLEMLTALFRKANLRREFRKNPNYQLVLHITGPVPGEHQEDLEKILLSYQATINTMPVWLADRIFIAFSVGQETHASFSENRIRPITIEDLYRMADVVVFPSETEGRGLPIIEASASGTPIICSHYQPREVFSDVIGENLPDILRIKYTLFPEGRFHRGFLSEVAGLLFRPDPEFKTIIHNREAVRARYSYAAFFKSFELFLNQLVKIG